MLAIVSMCLRFDFGTEERCPSAQREISIRPNRFPDILILFDEIITAPAGRQRRRVHF